MVEWKSVRLFHLRSCMEVEGKPADTDTLPLSPHRTMHWAPLLLTKNYGARMHWSVVCVSTSFLFLEIKHLRETMKWEKDSFWFITKEVISTHEGTETWDSS